MSVDAAPARRELKIMMGSKTLTAVLLVAGVWIIVGCTTVTSEVTPDREENWRYTVKEPRRESAPIGPVGELEYRGRDIAPYFDRIVISTRNFEYVIRVERSDYAGYRLSESPVEVNGTNSREAISEEELRREWYFAPLDRRKRGTPEEWVWVQRANVEAFVAPNRVSRLADALDINPIDGPQGDEPSPRFSVGIGITQVF